MRKIVLIPGSFNPVTLAHVSMGIKAKDKIKADEIIYIPVKDSFLEGWKDLKSKAILSGDIRFKLLKEAVSPFNFKVSRIEMDEVVSGKTYDTANYFKKLYDDSEIYLCFGLDNLLDIDRWYKSEDLIKENKFLIIDRDGKSIPDKLLNDERFKDRLISIRNDDYADVSSTMVRDAYINNDLDSIKDLIPLNVYKYLKENKEVYR